jgi:serine protease Do
MFPWSYFGFGNGYGNGYGGYGNGNGRKDPDSSHEVKYGSGSGVVVEKEYVLTNYHVVENSHSLKISIDGDEDNLYDATVAAFDEDKDVAVLYVPGLPLDPVELGDSDALQIGEWVVNIGNAIGFTGTATAGIVSGLNREIPGDGESTDKYGRATKVVNTMIQTDAAINSGNSGGGMFNTAGQLVGIPTLKYSGSRYSSGASVESIGMCIPINEAKDVIAQALSEQPASAEQDEQTAVEQEEQVQTGRLGKPRLGVTVTSMPSTSGMWPLGAYIVAVESGSPAEKAGLKPGDTLVEMNGEVITNTEELMNGLDAFKEGDTVKVTVWRPEEVGNAENFEISRQGDYVENIEVGLAMLDNVAQ